jgi:hypothetical protein
MLFHAHDMHHLIHHYTHHLMHPAERNGESEHERIFGEVQNQGHGDAEGPAGRAERAGTEMMRVQNVLQ